MGFPYVTPKKNRYIGFMSFRQNNLEGHFGVSNIFRDPENSCFLTACHINSLSVAQGEDFPGGPKKRPRWTKKLHS